MGRGDNRDTQMGWFIIIGTLPILIARSVVLQDAIESTLRNLWITVTVLISLRYSAVGGRRPAPSQVKTMDEMTWNVMR